ncbi:hypothetical protein H257_05811 [Aphanomyces astaci]|uniref:Uncharacterized protein n=1 Tax=Aphanomyces astaci TaxID=112090 RepID=W4GQS9_APHAT|nr:hypothetical protein H257_05811 [Aphanomyces astaci]ETV81248.1 hypothetical protein H257_05811 [Aphanomyces astaci]|eukprot:XP_009829106.1 hypothetical protein H257_05811 [Aphanomyces astaci]
MSSLSTTSKEAPPEGSSLSDSDSGSTFHEPAGGSGRYTTNALHGCTGSLSNTSSMRTDGIKAGRCGLNCAAWLPTTSRVACTFGASPPCRAYCTTCESFHCVGC